MAKQELSHSELWDDSALVNSWNEALAEYKKYHSLAAKGQKIDVDKADESELENGVAPAGEHRQNVQDDSALPQVNGSVNHVTRTTADAAAPQAQPLPGTATVPQALLGSIQDEGLKNLMMSWYYAGYYTGLYEGQQKAYAAMQHDG